MLGDAERPAHLTDTSMRTAYACLYLALLASAHKATAARDPEAPSVLGAGAAQCAQWSSYRAQNQDVLVDVIVSWTLGYVSGVAGRSRSHAIRHAQADATNVQDWLDKACLADSSRTIAEAARDLTVDLAHRAAAIRVRAGTIASRLPQFVIW